MYELPNEFKKLYKHWNKHANHIASNSYQFSNNELEAELNYFINERLQIWINKELLKSNPPYTKDPILQTYRFCNIFREFDKQTIFFHKFLKQYENNFELWLMNIFVCRMIANIDTINHLGIVRNENKDSYYENLMSLSSPKYGNAYVFPISVIQKSEYNTREKFICYYLPEVMKDIAKEIASWNEKSVYEAVEVICKIFGYNLKFLWTEVMIDIAYQFPEKIDLYEQFPIGPGSKPTLMKIDNKKDLTKLVCDLVGYNFKTSICYNGKELILSAENWEGIGCEFRKYQNLKLGTGRKRFYK